MTQSHSPSGADGVADRPRIIRWLVLAILAWGGFHAIGAWRFNHDPRRGLVVLGCVAAFLGFWMTMLAVRQRRLTPRR
jgi:CHASE2 domain-containing sensor protein